MMAILMLNSCMLVGSVFKAGFKLGIYSIFILAAIVGWLIYKRGNRR